MNKKDLLSNLQCKIDYDYIRKQLDPIRMQYERIKEEHTKEGLEYNVSWEEFLENRNKSAQNLGFKDAYDELYSNRKKYMEKDRSEK